MTDFEHKGLTKFASDAKVLTVGPPQPAMYAQAELHPTKKMQDNHLIDRERKHL